MNAKLLDKLNKLFIHSESAKKIGSKAEAEAFAAKVQAMCDEHNLSMDDVALHAERSAPIDVEQLNREPIDIQDWQRWLLTAVAKINGCIALMTETGFLFVAGRETDRKVAINFYRHFEQVIYDMGAEFEKSLRRQRESSGFEPRMVNFYSGATITSGSIYFFGPPVEVRVKSYALGMAEAIAASLKRSHAQRMERSTNPDALVFIQNKPKEAEDWIRSKIDLQDESRKDRHIDRDSYFRGLEDGTGVASAGKELPGR